MGKVLIASVAVAALAIVGAALADGSAMFRTPSGNIGCSYTGAAGSPKGYLRCDIGSGVKPLPKKPLSCQGDWGLGFSMNDTGKAGVTCASDTVLHQGFVLAYGKTWKRGGFVCSSATTGLKCTNRSQHGFFLSREKSYSF